VDRLAALAAAGQRQVAEALGVPLNPERLPVTPAPAMRLVPLPDGAITSEQESDAFYEALAAEGVEVAPVYFGGTGHLRVAAAPYNTADDYDRLADAVQKVLARSLRVLHRGRDECAGAATSAHAPRPAALRRGPRSMAAAAG
jgi:hypothetical protein